MQVQAFRGDWLETTHDVRAVAVEVNANHERRVRWQSGPATRSPWRSAGKHIQAWCCLQLLDGLSFDAEELAMAVSSHSGQPMHTARVAQMLARFGLDETALQCGAEAPVHLPTHHALIRSSQPAKAIHNDCSGKHALMLATCLHNGWSMDYLPADHPLQRQIFAGVSAWSGEEPGIAVDGCGVPTFALTVNGMANSWARMAAMVNDGHWRGTADAHMPNIGRAAMAHPELTSGTGRMDLAVAHRAVEPYFGKIGAEGIFCIALPSRRLGIAIKVLNGNEDALAVAVPAVLEKVAPGILAETSHWPWQDVRNVVGQKVGRRVAIWANGV